MTSFRHSEGGEINRKRPLAFTFDGLPVKAFEGDTIASALMANGIQIVGRSFKYHRPRGLWGAGVEEPNAFVDVKSARGFLPNQRATTVQAEDGMVVTATNATPTARDDRAAFIDHFARFIPSAFYYKTFMLPNWHAFEPRIRAMAGLGKVDVGQVTTARADQVNAHCDVLVIGGGAAGLWAARKAVRAGLSVMLCDSANRLGGALLHRDCAIEGKPTGDWVAATLVELSSAGARLLLKTMAFGFYDHGLVALNEHSVDGADRLWRVRPRHVVIAAGAIERPLPFANNDLPGIMSAEAALVYLRRYGVAPGRDIVLASNNSLAIAAVFEAAGATVQLIDYRSGPRITSAIGKKAVSAVKLDDGSEIATDCVLVSGGFTPTVHLYCQARGKLAWDDAILAFVPGAPVDGVSVIGAAAGKFTLAEVLASAETALAPLGIAAQKLDATGAQPYQISAAWPHPGMKGRVWIDLQHDVTAKDVELAARENMISVEHLKRYTTLGMATDQGKTSNLAGIALMAEITGRCIPEVGTTTYRPPFTPVPMQTLAGLRDGILMNPVRRLPLENAHRNDGAVFQEYGGWLRPAWYGAGDQQAYIQREAKQARETVALFDGSPLGKIEVIGPQAAEFMDFVHYNTMSSLKNGRCRYGFVLAESGIVYDDGVLVRLDDNRFILSCSSSHVAGMHAVLEEWRQDRFDPKRLFIHNVTAEYATIAVTGPRARDLLNALGVGADLNEQAFPHMATGWGQFANAPLRITRVSFTGDRSYELSIRADRAEELWTALKKAGAPFGVGLMGIEALMILRAEKGYIVVGKDTDGLTRPMDLGVSTPLNKKQVEFIGRRSLITPEANQQDRKQLVGLEVLDNGGALPTGAHGVDLNGKPRSIGYVTSSYDSPNIGRPIALALIERGASRHGEVITVQHLGQHRKARIVGPCVFDPEGVRLDA